MITPRREGFRRQKESVDPRGTRYFRNPARRTNQSLRSNSESYSGYCSLKQQSSATRSTLDVYAEIKKESVNLDQAFNIRADVFPDAFRHIIRVGTTKGDPSDMLSKYGERQLLTAENMAKVKGALIYPSVVLSLATAIRSLLAYFVIPDYGPQCMRRLLIQASGASLPWLTQALLAFSNFLVSLYGLITLALLVSGIVLLVRWLRTDNGKDWFQRKSLNWPLIGNTHSRVQCRSRNRSDGHSRAGAHTYRVSARGVRCRTQRCLSRNT